MKDQRYNFTLPLTPALDGVGGQRHGPAALPPGKDPLLTEQEAEYAPRQVWTGSENLAPNRGLIPGPSSLHRVAYEIYERSQFAVLSLFSFPFNPLTFTLASLSL